MGIRLINGPPRLILKLKKRKLNKTGAIMMRPCFCDDEGFTPKGLCPIHDFWGGIQREILPDELLFPSLQGENLNRILKAILARMLIPSASRYSTKAFRRGAAMVIMASGSTLAQIMRSAGWHSQAFRAYLMFQMEEECNMKAIFASSDRSKQSQNTAHQGQTLGLEMFNPRLLSIFRPQHRILHHQEPPDIEGEIC